MKKVQMSVAIPIMLTIVIVALTGVLLYNAYVKEQAPPPQGQNSAPVTSISSEGVYSHIEDTKKALAASTASKSTFAKGRYIQSAASSMEKASMLCTSKEQSLSSYALGIKDYLETVGNKLNNGGDFLASDGNNLNQLSTSLDATLELIGKAVSDSNDDYLKGDFPLPSLEQTSYEPINVQKAGELAAKITENPNMAGEEKEYFNFSSNEYILEVGKNSSVNYRRLGYMEGSGKLTKEALERLLTTGKDYLKSKDYGDFAPYAWQSGKGELAVKYYPVIGNTVYFNCPFVVIMSIDNSEILGLKTSPIATIQAEDNDELLNELKKTYNEHNYIVKGINEYGIPIYQVSYNENGKEYLANWSIKTKSEIKLLQVENSSYGRWPQDL